MMSNSVADAIRKKKANGSVALTSDTSNFMSAP